MAHPHLSRFAEVVLVPGACLPLVPRRASPRPVLSPPEDRPPLSGPDQLRRNRTNRVKAATKRMTKTMEHLMKYLFRSVMAVNCLVALVSVAQARSAYDGSWDLIFVT